MAVTDFSTKAAVVVRDDLVPWQRLNVTAFLVSGLIGAAEAEAIGEAYEDADGIAYLPLLVHPLLVFEGSADQLQRARAKASSRGAVRAVPTEELGLVGSGSGPTTATRTPCFAA
jgi:hypothetical protein